MDNTPNLLVGEKVIFKEVQDQHDKNDALKVRKDVFVEEQEVPVELEIDDFDSSPSTVHFVGYFEGNPIAAARLRSYAEKVGKVERVAVLKSARKIGIGALLMQSVEAKAKQLGFHKLKLNAQIHAAPFYTKLGYKSYGDIFMDADIEHIAMEKELD